MPQSYPAFLNFHSLKNCFGYTKSLVSITNKENNPNISENFGGPFLGSFRMRSCDNPNIYCDIQLFGSQQFTHVFVNSLFAEIGGFHEKQEIIVERILSTTICSFIEVAPRTENDYSIIAQSQVSIESNFLNQVRLLSNNMIFPYFVSKGVYVQLRVCNIVPPTQSSVILNNDTELHVQTVFEGSASDEKHFMAKRVSDIVQNLSVYGFVSNYVLKLEKPSLALRILPKEVWQSWLKLETENIDESTLYIKGKENSKYVEHGIVEVRFSNDFEKDIPEDSHFFYLHRSANMKTNDSFNSTLDHMLESLKLENKLHCIDGSLKMNPYTSIEINSVCEKRMCHLKEVKAFIEKKNFQWILEYELSNQVINALRAKTSTKPLLLSSSHRKTNILIEERSIEIRLIAGNHDNNYITADNSCFLLDSNTEICLRELKENEAGNSRKKKNGSNEIRSVLMTNGNENEEKEIENQNEIKTSWDENYGLNTFDDVVQIGSHSKHLSSLSSLTQRKGKHCLILGNHGSGKSYFLRRLARRLAHSSSVYFCKFIQCSSFKGKTSEAIEKVFTDIFNELEAKQPSVLLLDDFDVILPQLDQEQRQIPTEKIVSVFCHKLRSTEINVFIVAQRLSGLNEDFVESAIRSRPIISTKFELGSLTQSDRRELFQAWIDDKYCNLTEIIQKSDGFTITEVAKLAKTINLECAIRGSTCVERVDVQNALDSFITGKIGKEENDEILPTLNDVGGMFQQKALLQQVIIWPKKYPKLFESVGIPVSKGVLLHGPSGCGKTLLANAMISHSKFSVVTVKGPELLSKYIGASEENVRQVFEKARACAPCILFFDELDSLAPKRGSDSTGVTDRVVNQLLTELDGAEGGMKGVIVLGCTSRIDLIDDALLRPGRFDHHVNCSYPSEDERLDILRVLGKKVNTSNKIDFALIAKSTEGWSGADLQLLFTNAQFYKSRQLSEEDGLEENDITVDQNDLEHVFEESRPQPRKSVVDKRIGQKVTLA